MSDNSLADSDAVPETRDFTWRRLADGVYLTVAEPDAVNLGLVVGTESCLVIDTGSSLAQGQALRDSIAQVTPLPVSAAVLTHWHHDHAYGLGAFDDVVTYGHETVVERLADLDQVVPNRPLVVAAAVDLGGRRVEIAHLGGGHTDGDLLVVVADAGIVFAGDLIESAADPSIEPESVLNEWAGTLDGLIGLMINATIAVPGHGPEVNREFVFEQRGWVAMKAAELTAPSRPTLPLV